MLPPQRWALSSDAWDTGLGAVVFAVWKLSLFVLSVISGFFSERKTGAVPDKACKACVRHSQNCRRGGGEGGYHSKDARSATRT